MPKRDVIAGETKSILKKVSRTLYLSVNILPEPARSLMGLGYMLCRAMDTVVDTPGVPAPEKLEFLNLMRGLDTPGNAARLEELSGKLAPLAGFPGEKELLFKLGKLLALYERLPAHDKELFTPLFGGVAAGMEMDIKCFPGGQPAALQEAEDALANKTNEFNDLSFESRRLSSLIEVGRIRVEAKKLGLDV